MVDDDFTRQKLVIRFKLNHNDFPNDDDEAHAEGLALRLQAMLTEDGRAEINGFELVAGWIDILIFGNETDYDTDAIYAKIAPIFLDYPCLKGSYIVRQYSELGEDTKLSDTI